jgi:hypothetical protein
MKKEKIKNLCKMCDHKIYKDGEEIDVSSGGIMLRGGIKQIGIDHKDEKMSHRDLGDGGDSKIGNMKKEISESKKFKNLSHMMATKVLRQKDEQAELGKKAKMLDQSFIENDYHDICFIKPCDKKKIMQSCCQ